MKKFCISPININDAESVQPSPEDVAKAKRLEDDPAAILRIVDLIFGPYDRDDPGLPS